MQVYRTLLHSVVAVSLLALPAVTLAATATSMVTIDQSQNAAWVPSYGGTLSQNATIDTSTKVDGQVSAEAKSQANQHIWSTSGPLSERQTLSDGVQVGWNSNQWPTQATVKTASATNQVQHGPSNIPARGTQNTNTWLNSNIGDTAANATAHADQRLVSDSFQQQKTAGQTQVDGWFNPPMPPSSGHSGWLGNIFQNVNVFVQNTIDW